MNNDKHERERLTMSDRQLRYMTNGMENSHIKYLHMIKQLVL